MEYTKGKLCSCGFTQSSPIPHEHDRTEREKIIILHYENKLEAYSTMYEALKLALDETPWQPLGDDIKEVIKQALSLAEGKP